MNIDHKNISNTIESIIGGKKEKTGDCLLSKNKEAVPHAICYDVYLHWNLCTTAKEIRQFGETSS